MTLENNIVHLNGQLIKADEEISRLRSRIGKIELRIQNAVLDLTAPLVDDESKGVMRALRALTRALETCEQCREKA